MWIPTLRRENLPPLSQPPATKSNHTRSGRIPSLCTIPYRLQGMAGRLLRANRGERGMQTTDTHSDTAGAASRRGRPQDGSRDQTLRDTALDLLAEIGYDRLTIDAVAARARSSKTTIYRRWTGKAELVVDALNSRKGVPTIPDTGSLRTDLEAVVKGSTGMDSQLDAHLMMGLVSALANDTELRQAVRERLIDPSMTALKQMFERAVSRGEMGTVHNLDLLVSVFPALMIQRLLTTGETPDAGFAEQVVHDIILPLATCPDCVPAATRVEDEALSESKRKGRNRVTTKAMGA